MQVTMTQERRTPLSPGVAVLSPIEIQSVPARIDAVDANKWLHRLPPTRLVQKSVVTIPPGTVVSREPQENIPQGTGVEQEHVEMLSQMSPRPPQRRSIRTNRVPQRFTPGLRGQDGYLVAGSFLSSLSEQYHSLSQSESVLAYI